MATTMQCDIVSAEAQIYSGAVELLVGTEADPAVLPALLPRALQEAQ